MSINVLLIFDALRLLYAYNFTNMLFLFMYSNRMLLANTIFGIIGIFISIMLYKGAISVRLFLVVTLALWLLILSNYFFPMH
jgi:hypothetical protein